MTDILVTELEKLPSASVAREKYKTPSQKKKEKEYQRILNAINKAYNDGENIVFVENCDYCCCCNWSEDEFLKKLRKKGYDVIIYHTYHDTILNGITNEICVFWGCGSHGTIWEMYDCVEAPEYFIDKTPDYFYYR